MNSTSPDLDPADYTDAPDDFDYAPDTSIETADDIEWQASAALRQQMADEDERASAHLMTGYTSTTCGEY